MSKIALTPSATGTGVFTIASPATSTDRTLTLPDEAGTVLTSASSLASANLTGTVTVSGANVGIGTAAPAAKLHLYTVGLADGILIEGNDNNNVKLRLKNIGTGGEEWQIQAGQQGASNSGFHIRSNTSGTNALSLIGGNVGIGGIGNLGNSANDLVIYSTGAGHNGLRMHINGILPTDNTGALIDNDADLGDPSYRFKVVYAGTGSINTSDRTEKQDIDVMSEAETRVAVACKGLIRKFRWIDAVAKKGDDARIHFGIIAQDLQDAFAAEGLDASRYAMFCSDTWWEADRVVPAVEDTDDTEAVAEHTVTDTYDTLEEAPEGATERTRLGVRYSELLAFIIGAL